MQQEMTVCFGIVTGGSDKFITAACNATGSVRWTTTAGWWLERPVIAVLKKKKS
jgi:hypothetical protein